MTPTEYRVAARFRGPAGMGNGGYVAGRAALLLGAHTTEVTLRRGVPLDQSLQAARVGDKLQVTDAEGNLVVEAKPATLDLTPPPSPSVAEAEEAARWFVASPFSHSDGLCFACGSNRPPGEGLRVFTGAVPGRPGLAAALWRPDAAYAGPDGRIAPEFLWTALDCAGHFAFSLEDKPMRMLLGRITARLDGPVEPGEPCIVIGWQLGKDGRKHSAGTAIFGADGGLRGIAQALWVTPAPGPAG